MNLIDGLLTNLLITVGSCVLPIIVGVLFCILCDKNKSFTIISRVFGAFFESICPIITIFFLYFSVPVYHKFSREMICIMGFSVSFLGYMPLRHNTEYSLAKNLVVNFLGLISNAFKWSFVAGMISVADMLGYAKEQLIRSYDIASVIIVLLIAFAIVFALEMARVFVKEKM